MHTQALSVQLSLLSAQGDGLGLLCLLWAGPGALQPPWATCRGTGTGQGGWGGQGCGYHVLQAEKKGNSGIGTDSSQPFLVLIRRCGTLGTAGLG